MRSPDRGLIMNRCAVAGFRSAGTFSSHVRLRRIFASAEASDAVRASTSPTIWAHESAEINPGQPHRLVVVPNIRQVNRADPASVCDKLTSLWAEPADFDRTKYAN